MLVNQRGPSDRVENEADSSAMLKQLRRQA
jgi:hypothetical protein